MPSLPALSQSTPPNDPRLPPELFLEIFSYDDLPTLSALSSSSLAFLELATPFLYNTVHFDDFPSPQSLELQPSPNSSPDSRSTPFRPFTSPSLRISASIPSPLPSLSSFLESKTFTSTTLSKPKGSKTSLGETAPTSFLNSIQSQSPST
jgi:hypothetical protein